MAKRLEGKVAIVTGAGSGIGRATAIAFAREGANVVLAGRRSRELEETAAAARDAGGEAIARPADVTREADVAGVVATALDRFGRLDVGFNAAGGTYPSALAHELDEATFRLWLDGHLVSAFLSTKHQLAAMLGAGGGSIVNVGTFVGHTKALAGASAYAAAKTGLLGFTRTVAAEGARKGVRANVLVVGGVQTPMFDVWNDDEEKRAAARALHAVGRIGRPDEIASAAVFLASDESSFVTGSALSIEGGVSLV